MHLTTLLTPLFGLGALLSATVSAQSSSQTADVDPPKNIVVARYYPTHGFQGRGGVMYGIERCISFA
jgi:hypothetical protein